MTMEALFVGGPADGHRQKVTAVRNVCIPHPTEKGMLTYRRIRLPEGCAPVVALYVWDDLRDVTGMELLINGYPRRG